MKFYTEMQGFQNKQNNLGKEHYGRFTLLNFNTYYKVIVIKTGWYWRSIDGQWNIVQISEVNPFIYG